MLPPVEVGGGGVGNNGSGATSSQTWTMIADWALAPGCPVPDHFEVVAYTGSDPTTNWLFPPVSVTAQIAAAFATAHSLAQPYGISIQYGLTSAPGSVSLAVASIYLDGATSAPVRTKPLPLTGGGVP